MFTEKKSSWLLKGRKKIRPQAPKAKDTIPGDHCSAFSSQSSASQQFLLPHLQTKVPIVHTAQCFSVCRNVIISSSFHCHMKIICSNHSSLHCTRSISPFQAGIHQVVVTHWRYHEKVCSPRISCLPFGKSTYFNVVIAKERPLKSISIFFS